MGNDRRQFRTLYRDFLLRMADPEIVSARGDVKDVLVRFVAVLAAISFMLAFLIVPHYMTGATNAYSVWNDQEFLLSATIAVTGFFAVLAWDAVFPTRDDCLILGPLPVPIRMVALAKVAAAATALALSILAINAFTGLTFPLAVSDGFRGGLRSLAVWWTVSAAAGVFAFASTLALQGIASQLLPWRFFMRISGILQLVVLAAVLTLFFAGPAFALTILREAPEHSRLIQVLPSFWFTGLLHEFNGDDSPAFRFLASVALRNLLAALTVAGIVFSLSYSRNLRRIAETPDIAPSDRVRAGGTILNAISRVFLPKPLDRAILRFTARTIARSREHRLLLAVYGGAGFAIALTFLRSLLEGGARERWNKPNVPLMVVGFLLVFFAVAGTRAIFAIPQTLPANWIFRTTAVHSPAAYFASVRKTLIALAAVPAWIAAALLYFALWPGRPALEHTIVLIVGGFALIDLSLYQFRKIPFACSWLPGDTQMKLKSAIQVVLFVILAGFAASIELWTLQKPARFAVITTIVLTTAFWSWRRRARFAAATENRIEFEALPAVEIFALDLRRDGEWSSDRAWMDAVDPNAGQSFLVRARPFVALICILLAAGLAYESAGEWRDRRLHPRIGQSFDIGGRALNIFCSGEGSPTVILEGSWGAPGYTWVAIQRALAKITRTCWYDRAGLGWSDPGPFPNHSDSIARDLHKLLGAARVPPPYVLVGHSMGGFHVRVFRGFYPAEVSGMVLVDPMNEDMTINIHNHIEAFRPAVVLLFRTLGTFGVFRLFAAPDPGLPPKSITEDEWATIGALKLQPKWVSSQAKEPPLWISGELARASGGLGSIPLIVLCGGRDGPAEDRELEDRERKIELDTKLARLSTRGRAIVVRNSGPRVPYDAPESVIDAVRTVIAEVR